MRRVFKTRAFQRWLRKTELSDTDLCVAVAEMAAGLIDARLGGNLVKKRVALGGRGKQGGARTLVATKQEDRWFFLFGFEKNERENIDGAELKALQELAADYLGLSESGLENAVHLGKLLEICHGTPALN
jgi:hypothetical protein